MVVPPVPELEEHCLALRHVAVDDPQHGLCVVRAPMPLVWPHEHHNIQHTQAYAGLESRIMTVLEDAGYRVRMTGTRPAPLPAPRPPKSGKLAPDATMLDFIRSHERGIIRYSPTHIHVDRLSAPVAEAYPQSRILVVTTRRNETRWLRKRLTVLGHRVGWVLEGWVIEGNFCVCVSPYVSLGRGVCEVEHRDIAIYLNPTEVFCETGCEGLRHLWRARVSMPWTMRRFGSATPTTWCIRSRACSTAAGCSPASAACCARLVCP